jgi:hypothetical protein
MVRPGFLQARTLGSELRWSFLWIGGASAPPICCTAPASASSSSTRSLPSPRATATKTRRRGATFSHSLTWPSGRKRQSSACITFTKRGEDADPVDRVSGSLAFGAGPRVVFLSALDRKAAGEPRGVLMRAKNNIGPTNGGFEFGAETRPLADRPEIAAQRILWRFRQRGGPRHPRNARRQAGSGHVKGRFVPARCAQRRSAHGGGGAPSRRSPPRWPRPQAPLPKTAEEKDPEGE